MTRLRNAVASLLLYVKKTSLDPKVRWSKAFLLTLPTRPSKPIYILITSTCAGIDKPNETYQHGGTAGDQKTVRLARGKMIDGQQNDSNKDNQNTGQTYECAFHNDCEIMFLLLPLLLV